MQGRHSETLTDPSLVESPKDSLTEQDRENIPFCVDAIDSSVNSDSEASYALLEKTISYVTSMGHDALPYLVGNLKEKNTKFHSFEMGVWVNLLAQPEDIDLVVDIATSVELYINSDTETLTPIFETLNESIVSIRENNPNDPRLNEAAKKVLDIVEMGFGTQYDEKVLLTTLALTGTTTAINFLETQKGFLSRIDSSRYEVLVNDVGEARFICPEKPPKDIKTIIQELRQAYLSTVETDLKPEVVSFEAINEEYSKLCERANEIAKEIEGTLEPSILQSVKLGIFNYLRNNPEVTEKDINGHLAKYIYMSRREARALKEDYPLPTIGIEAECPLKSLSDNKIGVLDRLGVKNGAERGLLWEVKPAFNYDYLPQARILQELGNMRAIPLEKATYNNFKGDKVEVKVLPEDEMISLHINLGLPEGINLTSTEIFEKYRDQIELFSDLLTYGYTSPKRILKRKTKIGVALKDEDTVASTKGNTGDKGVMRMELRATEFRDFPTYRLLHEAQSLGGMLFSYMKRTEGAELSEKENQLADLWEEFSKEASETVNEFIPEPRMYDIQHTKAAQILEDTELKTNCRKVSKKFAQKIDNIVE